MNSILITGGSGFIGHELVRQLLPTAISRIVIYSRSESAQAKMKQEYPEMPENRLRYLIGDVRDAKRLETALKGCDAVIHAAALKRVEVAEYDPAEAVKTNVYGTQNVIEACHSCGVKKAVFISTDKAVEPTTIYGASKLAAERLWIASNNLGSCRLSVVRYANVYGSTGSLYEVWQKQVKNKQPITITDPNCTRMWLSRENASESVIKTLKIMQGGEIFIPHCDKMELWQSYLSFRPSETYPTNIIGLRPAEKLHETLISEYDARDCYEIPSSDYPKYVILPQYHEWIAQYQMIGKKLPDTFRLVSNGSI